jgi:stage II sporulation protein P
VKSGHKVQKRWIVTALFLLLSAQLFKVAIYDMKNNISVKEKLFGLALNNSLELYSPYILYVNDSLNYNLQSNIDNPMVGIIWQQLYDDIPLVRELQTYNKDMAKVEEYVDETTTKDNDSLAKLAAEENALILGEMSQNNDNSNDNSELEQKALLENTVATGDFVPVESPVAVYSKEQLESPSFIKKTFYSEDATTYIKEEQLQYDKLMGYDATLKQNRKDVQILVYHTHSQEDYIDSIPGDSSTSIVGVGEHLCDILRNKYGFNVLHHLGEYDVESRDYAYSRAMEGLENVLMENPTIEVMIDLHRDETNPDTKLVTTIQDKPMAKFMFFNGLCYTRELGELTNLPNPYIQDNLSFAFQLQLAAEEYYPGLTRRIYLKGYRYNLHYRSKSLLIELGSQTNTVEEAMNTCEPLAHIISIILNGDNKE